MDPIQLFKDCRSGVAQISYESNGHRLANGTGFLVSGGVVTNSHVIRGPTSSAITIRFENQSGFIRIDPNYVLKLESPENRYDYAFLEMDEPEFKGRYRFQLGSKETCDVGQLVCFFGFPFGMDNLTCHMAYISSIFERNAVTVIQLDGSINGGNSGGPLLSLKSGNVIGIVTRAHTGLIEQKFRELIESLRNNQRVLANAGQQGGVQLLGINPIQALQASQAAMEQIALDLHRSANVGIGYAFSCKHLAAELR